MSLPPLPPEWVDRIFAKLVLVYGVDFMNRYREIDVDDVKADWALELAGFTRRPEAIRHALENLPAGKPPTVLEFREIARKVPNIAKTLPAPPASPNVLQAELKRLDAVRRALATDDPKAWARRLIAKHEAGQWVRPSSLQAARAALRMHLEPQEAS